MDDKPDPEELHDCVLQLLGGLLLEPEQTCPPLAGVGLLHCLVLFWLPPPHVFVQDDQDDHDPQLPFTGPS